VMADFSIGRQLRSTNEFKLHRLIHLHRDHPVKDKEIQVRSEPCPEAQPCYNQFPRENHIGELIWHFAAVKEGTRSDTTTAIGTKCGT